MVRGSKRVRISVAKMLIPLTEIQGEKGRRNLFKNVDFTFELIVRD